MKRFASIFLVVALTVISSGCFQVSVNEKDITASSLTDPVKKKDKFTLDKALNQNANAFEYAVSNDDPFDNDAFLTYIESAKIAQELELSGGSKASPSSLDADLSQAAADFGSAVGTMLTSIFNPLTSLAVPTSGTSGTSGSTNSGTTGGGSSGGSSGGGSGTSGGSGSSGGSDTQTQSDKNYQTLMSYYAEFQTYQAKANSTINNYNTNPWSSRDNLISDDTMINLYVSSYRIFDFIKAHQGVKDGDMVLSSVGDTMVSIYLIWGVGHYEAQTAFLMVNLYYPNGSYVIHAEEQLLLL